MLSDKDEQADNIIKQSFVTTKKSNNIEPQNIHPQSENIATNINIEQIQKTPVQVKNQPSHNIDLDHIWKKVIAMLELPSTKMLLSQQAKLINLTSDSAEIVISGKWINMIQSRKKLIEDAFYQARGSSTKVILIQQDDNLLNRKKEERNLNETERRKEFKLETKQNKSTLDEKRKRKLKVIIVC